MKFNGRTQALHAVWDDAIIERIVAEEFAGDEGRLMAALQKSAAGGDARAWGCNAKGGVCAEAWAQESIQFACKDAYKNGRGGWIQSGDELSDAYFKRADPIVKLRLAQGGVRLAAILNHIFDA